MKNTAFAAFLVFLAMGSATADPRDDALSAMLRCSGISERAQRLACYDSAVMRVPGALNTMSSSAPAAAPLVTASVVPPPAPAVTPRRKRGNGFMDRLFGAGGPKRAPQTSVAQFGSESIANGGLRASPIAMDGDTIDQISARLVSYEFGGGYVTVTLDNGQVWRQTAGGEALQSLSRPALSYSAVISRGGGGSYDMKLSGLARIVPVRRIR
jgi:hypothetical protein